VAAEIAFDMLVVAAFMFVYAWVDGQPTWSLYFIPPFEAALRFGFAAGIMFPIASAPVIVAAEVFRAEHFQPDEFRTGPVATRIALTFLVAAFVGQLVEALREVATRAEDRAAEFERARDEIGRRLDLLEAANRCARALGSSLDPNEAFAAFARELRGVVPVDRWLVWEVDGQLARVIAGGGVATANYPVGSTHPVEGTVVGRVSDGRTLYRPDMTDRRFSEEDDIVAAGIRSRVMAPLQVGARTIGALSVGRRAPRGFSGQEVELMTLLGRLIASSVQNIRTYDAERATAEELRRLSSLRADFVSIVSHELRSPMAAVVGAARTLRKRWPELSDAQRESFLDLVAREGERLAALIGDVLDTSRMESGSLRYAFGEVDVASLIRAAADAADAGQADVRVVARLPASLPVVRGDDGRLRQVVTNLVDNAIKYSPRGGVVHVSAAANDGVVHVHVADDGPGISPADQEVIFEKFGRATAVPPKPGTGLGLFLARSIAEAHGGSVSVASQPGRGSTFTLTLPLAAGG
jgi:signal transduction histidine kinase